MIRRTLILFGLLIHIVFAAPGQGVPQPALNGRAFSMQFNSAEDLWIPVSFLKDLGIESTFLFGQNELLMHSNGQRLSIPLGQARSSSLGLELPLALLEERLNIRTMHLGNQVYLFPQLSQLRSLGQTQMGIRFAFSAFAPVNIEKSDAGLRLTFFNVQPVIATATRRFSRGVIHSVSLEYEADAHRIQVQLHAQGPFDYTVARRETGSEFTLELRVQASTVSAPIKKSLRPKSSSLAPGVSYREQVVPTAAGNSIVRSVWVERFQQRYHLRTVVPERGLGTLAPLSQMAQKRGAAVAINANFYDPKSKSPIGLLIQDGTLEREDYAKRGALGVDVFGGVQFFNPDVKLQLVIGDEHLSIDGINRPAKQNEIVTITPLFGQTVRSSELATVVRLIDERVVAIFSTFVVTPDRHSTFLIATGEKRALLAGVKRGDSVQLRRMVSPAPRWPLRFAVSAGPMLVRDGQVILDAAAESFNKTFAAARAARSAIGLTADGTLILLIALQGDDSAGLTLDELARLMQTQGAVHALAFDGGGSASLAFRQGIIWRNVGSNRSVAVGLALIPQ